MPLAYAQTELNEVLASIDRVTFHEYQKAFFSGFKAEVFLHGPALRTDSESLILDWVGRLPLDENTPDVEITTGFWPESAPEAIGMSIQTRPQQCYTWIGILGRISNT